MTTKRSIALILSLALSAGSAAALQARLMQRSPTEADLQARADELLAEARLHAELGGHEKALELYQALAGEAAQPLRVRGQARLGEALMQRRLDAITACLDAFFEAIAIARELEDVQLAQDIVEGSGAVRPAASSWEEIEPLLGFDRLRDESGRERVVPPEGLQAAATATATAGAAATLRATMDWPAGDYTGAPISVSLKDADLIDLFRMLTEISGLNIIVDSDLRGETVTMEVTEVPWDQVLATIMRTNGLDSRFEGNVLRIAPKEKLAAEDAKRAAVREVRELAGEARSIARSLEHADGQVALERVSGMLSARGSVQLDRRTNTLIVKDIVSRMPEIEALLDDLDRPPENRFTGEPISLSLRGADVPDLFRMFGEISGLELRVDDRLRGRAWDVAYDDEPWDSVLWRLLVEHGLVMLSDGHGGYVVLPRPEEDATEAAAVTDNRIRVIFRPEGGWGDGAPDVLPPIKRLGW